jgi:hypothetical protein
LAGKWGQENFCLSSSCLLFVTCSFVSAAERTVTVTHWAVEGIGAEPGVMRRDPSDISKTHKVTSGPWAGGAYRPEAFTQSGNGDIPEWGVEIARQKKQSGKLPFIQRFDVTEKK